MAHLQSAETQACCDAFLNMLFGSNTYSKWQSLKVSMNFTSEEDFVCWMLEFIDSHNKVKYDEKLEEYWDGGCEMDHSASTSYTSWQENQSIQEESNTTVAQQVKSECASSDLTDAYQPNSSQRTSHDSNSKVTPDIGPGHHEIGTGNGAYDGEKPPHDEDAEFSVADYQCNQCDSTFLNSLARMTHHRLEHADSLDCGMCGKQFNKKSHLYRHHDAVHRKVKNYWCQYCERGFAQNQNLKLHIDKVHLKLAIPSKTSADPSHTCSAAPPTRQT